MEQYTPDRWVVLEINNGTEILKKVFAGWYGGFEVGDSWKLNSGNVKEEDLGDRLEFTGYSGSKYICYKKAYGTSSYIHQILENWVNQLPTGATMKVDLSYNPPKEAYDSL